MGLVYLATPYTHLDPAVMERRFLVANRVAASLMRAGVYVFSPISHTHPIAIAGDLPRGWEFWEGYDMLMIKACDKLLVLMQDGWRESTGVMCEIRIARSIPITVEYMECDNGFLYTS